MRVRVRVRVRGLHVLSGWVDTVGVEESVRLTHETHDSIPGSFDCCAGGVHGVGEVGSFEEALDFSDFFGDGGCGRANL